MNRREFIGLSAAAAASLMIPSRLSAANAPVARPQPRIPRWRGFNLPELAGGHRGPVYHELDFQWLAEWKMNFARLPLSYWVWSDRKEWMKIDEDAFQPVDQAIEFGRQYGIHLNLNLHRIPGYCVN